MARQPTTPSTPATGLQRPTLGQRVSPGRFFTEVISELRKVNWPTRVEATRLTVLVLAVSVSIGLLLGFIDNGFARLFALVTN